ncbi:MAG: JAB domain-containing protein [bacterium]
MTCVALRSPVFRVALVQDESGETPVVSPMDAALLFKKHIGNYDREAFAVIMLDPGKRLIGLSLVSIGTLTGTSAHPREIFKAAILASAHSLLVGHCHVAGDPTPSTEDKILTKRLIVAGEILGIEVLDHMIVTPNRRFFSFRRNSVLEFPEEPAAGGEQPLDQGHRHGLPRHPEAGSPR